MNDNLFYILRGRIFSCWTTRLGRKWWVGPWLTFHFVLPGSPWLSGWIIAAVAALAATLDAFCKSVNVSTRCIFCTSEMTEFLWWVNWPQTLRISWYISWKVWRPSFTQKLSVFVTKTKEMIWVRTKKCPPWRNRLAHNRSKIWNLHAQNFIYSNFLSSHIAGIESFYFLILILSWDETTAEFEHLTVTKLKNMEWN